MRKIVYLILYIVLVLSVVRCTKGGKAVGYEPQPDDKEQFLRWATEKVELCRQQNDETEALRTEAEIGFVIAQLGEVEEGLAKLNRVIGALDWQRHFNEMDACVIAMKRKIDILDQLERPAEIIPIAQHIIRKIDDYRQHSDEYADGSFRLPTSPEQFTKYCNFYTAQAYGFLAKANADIGINKTARCYVELFEESDYGKTYSGRMMIAPTWCKLGEFDKMLAIYDVAAERFGSDTINLDYATMLYGWALASDASGNNNAARKYWQRYSNMQNLLNKKQREGQAYHYAARYHLQEERMKAEQEKAKAKNNKNIAWAGFALVFLSICFIIRLLIQRHAIKRNNQVLIDQVSESINKKNNDKAESNDINSKTSNVTPDLANMNEKQLLDYLSDIIRREKLFLNSGFGRQTLIDRFKVNERRIGAAFALTNGLPDFIRDLRLDYACQLFAEHSEMSISDVAEASGFSNLTVFGRDFKRKYEVTPTNYRNQKASKK